MEEKLIDQEEVQESLEEKDLTLELTNTRKIILIVVGFITYFLFLLFLLPYSNLLKNFLKNSFKEYQLEFSTLEFGFFSPTIVKNLYVSNQSNIDVSLETLTLKLNFFSFLLSKQIESEVFSSSGSLKLNELNINIKNFNSKLQLENIETPIEKWSGMISIQIKNLELLELFGQLKNFNLPENQREIRNFKIQIVMDKGSYTSRVLQLDSELFQIKGAISGNLFSNISNTTISGKICFAPNQNLEEKNPFLYSLYLGAGGSLGGELCVKISGSLADLKFNVDQTQ